MSCPVTSASSRARHEDPRADPPEPDRSGHRGLCRQRRLGGRQRIRRQHRHRQWWRQRRPLHDRRVRPAGLGSPGVGGGDRSSSDQSAAAIEEIPSVDLYDVGKPLSLMAAQSTTIERHLHRPRQAIGALERQRRASRVPSLIPGRPPLTFQAPTVSSSTSMSSAIVDRPERSPGQRGHDEPGPAAASRSSRARPRSFSVPLADGLQVHLPTDDFFVQRDAAGGDRHRCRRPSSRARFKGGRR